MTCEHHWHDQGVYETCCECNSHKCEAIQRVRELHYMVSEVGAPNYCSECRFWYPCRTIKAIDCEIGSVEPVKLGVLDGEQG